MDLKIQDFWQFVADLCKQKGVSQTELCDDLKIPSQTYKGWKLHGRYPPLEEALKIAHYFGLSVENLYNRNLLNYDTESLVIRLNDLPISIKKAIITNIESQIDYWTQEQKN